MTGASYRAVCSTAGCVVCQVVDTTSPLPERDQTDTVKGSAGTERRSGRRLVLLPSVGRVVPGVTDADVDVERHVELGGVPHLVTHELLEIVTLAGGDLED